MRKNQSSLSAAGIAIARVVESEKSTDERLIYDPYARQLVPVWMVHIMGFFIRSGYAELRGPGVNGYLMARERYIDDVLQDFLKAGLQQLVILGAGYDSRAHRFDFPQQMKIFEVDHPATQTEKLEKVQKIFGKFPANIRYVPVDFNTQTLSECLLSAGYDPDLVTLLIWQGVTMYLTAEAVDSTLAFVLQNSAPGSAIVFDYLYRALLDGVQKQSEVSNMRRYRLMTGEGLTFGIPEGTVESFLEARGFRQVFDVGVDDLKAAYFTGKNASRKIVGGYGIVVGKV
ncbi:MAG: SAM-dependent methyltransferase [Chloroflexi bacterium HGW-Chloroflexi-10]|nr:MAG: SAM-dependent methyltransferase [Chloroflexi bacterium HGW-Chloroflexi-10]